MIVLSLKKMIQLVGSSWILPEVSLCSRHYNPRTDWLNGVLHPVNHTGDRVTSKLVIEEEQIHYL